jgi:hypothetical protein
MCATLQRLVVVTVLSTLGTAAWAGPAADKCESGKNKEAGTYALCLQKAEAKFALTADAVERSSARTKCADRLTAKWNGLEAKAAAAGDPCPTSGDQARIQAAFDALSSLTATGLAGLRFVDNGDGTVTDTTTRLMWEEKTGAYNSVVTCGSLGSCPDPHHVNNRYSWTSNTTEATGTVFSEFLGRLNGANDGVCFAGHCDWRLPTEPELRSLLRTDVFCFRFQCIEPGFPGSAGGIHWTGTTLTTNATRAMTVSFIPDFGDFALVPAAPKTINTLVARAVRTLQ